MKKPGNRILITSGAQYKPEYKPSLFNLLRLDPDHTLSYCHKLPIVYTAIKLWHCLSVLAVISYFHLAV